jgi:hypothetical protein
MFEWTSSDLEEVDHSCQPVVLLYDARNNLMMRYIQYVMDVSFVPVIRVPCSN